MADYSVAGYAYASVGSLKGFEANLKSETHVHQRTGIRGSEHGAVILPGGTAVVECHTCVQADHVVFEEGVLIAQARVARQAGDIVLPGGSGVVFGLNLREQGRRLKASYGILDGPRRPRSCDAAT